MNFVPIVKPVGGRCNIQCYYCYFNEKKIGKSMTVMNDDCLRSLIDQFCSKQESIEFVWHGGEPLLAGIDFYQRVVDIESKWSDKGKKIYNSIQTNGILINKRWAEFFAKNSFGVGVSLDGPSEIHDAIRVLKGAEGSFKMVMDGISVLREYRINPSVICCVSSVNNKFAKKIFHFLVTNGFKKIKFLQVQGRDEKGDLLPYSVTSEEYADFLISAFEELIKLDNPHVEIREIESIVNTLLGGDNRECMFAGECYKYITIYSDGSMYGCDSLPKIGEMRFGHIKDGLYSIESSENFKKFYSRMQGIHRECALCKWYNVCRGGCPQDYWPNILSQDSQNQFCGSLKKIFSEFEKILNTYGLLKAND